MKDLYSRTHWAYIIGIILATALIISMLDTTNRIKSLDNEIITLKQNQDNARMSGRQINSWYDEKNNVMCYYLVVYYDTELYCFRDW